MDAKRIRRIIISIIFTLLFGAIAFFVYGGGVYMPFSTLTLADISDVAVDLDGNSYILNNGGYEAIRVNPKGNADLVIKGLGSRNSSFERGLHIEVDGNDNIYVHNRVAAENAVSWIGKENIKVYNRKGNYLYTSCEITYDVPALRSSIIGLQNVDGDVFAFLADEQVILMENVENGDISMYPYPQTKKYINAVCYYKPLDCLYATTRDGKLVRIDSKGYEVLYSTPEGDVTSGVFDDITVDDSGVIYVCDVRKGEVVSFDGETLQTFFAPVLIPYDVGFDGVFVFNETYSVVRQEANHYYSVHSTGIDGFASRKSVFYLFALLFMILSLLYPVYCIVFGILRSKSVKVKIISGLTVVVAILTVGFCMLVSNEYKMILSDDVIQRAMLDAKLVNNLLDPEDFQSLNSVTDFGSDAYSRIKKIVDNVILDGGKIPGDMYLIMYTLEEDGSVTERYSLEEIQGCNYPYIWSDGTDEQIVYNTGETFQINDATDAEGSFLCIYSPIENSKGETIGVIEVGTDITIFQKSIRERMFYFAISTVALAAVFILLLLEIIEFVEAKRTFTIGLLRKGLCAPPLKIYRVVVFTVFFVTNITTPFLSIYALSLSDRYTTLFRMQPEILAAIPISAEVLFGAIFSMLGGNIIKRLGNRKSAFLGSVVFTVGLIIRFLYPDLIVLTIGNAMQGAGWGIVLLIVNAKIAAEQDEQKQEQGFTDYNIALQNGMNSGIVLGGFLLSFASYNGMLIFAAILSVVILLFAYFFIFDFAKSEEVQNVASEESGNMSYWRFILSPRVLIYFLCIVVPVIAASYYLNFLYPILGDNLGMSESIIGYSYLINGIVIICFGNLIVNVMSKYFDKKILLMIASIIYLVTFAMVGMFNSVPALLVSLVLLGISDSFGYVAQSTFYTDLAETKAFGYEKAMGVYSLFENLSQSAGSFIFGYILTVGIRTGMTAYGVTIGVCGVLFVIVAVICDKMNKRRGASGHED